MTKPLKRDDSGYYYFRKEVPLDLREAVGKTAIKFSLRTKILSVAQVKTDELHRHWDSVFARLRSARIEVSHQDRLGLVGLYCEKYLQVFESEPREQAAFDPIITKLASHQIRRRWGTNLTQKLIDKSRLIHRTRFKSFLLEQGVVLSETEIDTAMPYVLDAIVLADGRIEQMKRGEYKNRSVKEEFPQIDLAKFIVDEDGVRLDLKKYGTLHLFDKMAVERAFAPSTIKRHRPIIEKVSQLFPDIRAITPEWCVEWKDGLLNEGRSPRTVKQVYLAALSNLANFAISQRALSSNPLDGLYLKVRKKRSNRTQKGYTEAEARVVLGAALGAMKDVPPHTDAFARRWMPWLCCYTGARVGEIAQLRKKDIQLEEGVWVIQITPEAGTTKDSRARRVPVHPHLMAQGFIDMLPSRADGYLFCPADGKRTPATVADDLGRWVREIGIDDPELQPSHGWRHRFKTVARRFPVMDPAVRDYLQGHVPHNEAEGYGNQEAPVLLEWLSLIKWIKVEGDLSYAAKPSTPPQPPNSPRLVWSAGRLVG